MSDRKQVVIVGGGFAGLAAAQALKNVAVDVTLVDRRNFHLFQPLLYQVATGGLSPADIASPLRGILSRQRNVRVVQGEATDVDPTSQVVTVNGEPFHYDYLLVATGSKHHYFGNDDWEQTAPGLKTVEDALEIRRRVLGVFEQAELEQDSERREALITFVVVGGGPTGVELAGALGELANHTLRDDFRNFDTSTAKILLVEGANRILQNYTPQSSKHAVAALERLGVTVLTNTLVQDVETGQVKLVHATGQEIVQAETILWGAGVRASTFGRRVATTSQAKSDSLGRIEVEPDLSVPGHPDLFVLGDLAHFRQNGQPVPGVAPAAMQQGKYVADLIRRRLKGRPTRSFRYKDHGSMAVIGCAAAVAELGGLKIRGYLAWLIWLFIHLVNLVEYRSRVLVLIQWGWSYFTRNRSARLITYRGAVFTRRKTSLASSHLHFAGPRPRRHQLSGSAQRWTYDGLRESDFNQNYYDAWCAGRTGYPMVDACMRALLHRSWINVRMRAMLVSFASYHLWLHWRPTAVFLARHFLDFEPGDSLQHCVKGPLQRSTPHDATENPNARPSRNWRKAIGDQF